MKLYVDLSCDKVSGQQIMQRKFKDYCENCGILSTKEEADVLVYVQVPLSQDLQEWRELKQQGKKIVFIHHYLVKEIVDIVAIFKIPELLEMVDMHIIMSVWGDILKCLHGRKIDDTKIKIIEQAGVNRDNLEQMFFKKYRKPNSICYVGRAKKGLDKFIQLTEDLKGWRRTIFCPDIEKHDNDLTKYEIFTDLTDVDLFEKLSEHRFMYSPYVYSQPYFHLETSIHEAVHCGTAVIVDAEFKNVIPNYMNFGFIRKDEFEKMKYHTLRSKVIICSIFLYQCFRSAEEIAQENLDQIRNYFQGERR